MAIAAWGIDIGGSSIKVVKLMEGKAGLEVKVLDVVEVPLPTGDQPPDRNAQVTALLKGLRQKHKFKKTDVVYFSIPGHTVFHRSIPIFAVEDKKALRELVALEAQQQIPFPIVDIIWDYQINATEVKAGEEIPITLYAVRRDIIQNFLNILGAAEIPASGIQVAPLAIFNFARFEKAVRNAVVIDIGAENTDLLVIEGARCWMRNINTAGNQVTRSLEKRFQIPFAEAEKLKIKAPKSKQAEKIYELLKPTLRELVADVNRSMGFYKSQSESTTFEKLILLGNGSKLLGLKHFFEENFPDMAMERVAALEKFTIDDQAVDPALYQNNVPAFAVALGLALQGLGRAENGVNLIPPELRGRVEKAKSLPWIYATLGVLYLAVLLWGLAARGEAQKVSAAALQAKTLEKRVRDVQETLRREQNNSLYRAENAKLLAVGARRDASLWFTGHLVAALQGFNDDKPSIGDLPIQLGFMSRPGQGVAQPAPFLTVRHFPYNGSIVVPHFPPGVDVAKLVASLGDSNASQIIPGDLAKLITNVKVRPLSDAPASAAPAAVGVEPPPTTGMEITFSSNSTPVPRTNDGSLGDLPALDDPVKIMLAAIRAKLPASQEDDAAYWAARGLKVEVYPRWVAEVTLRVKCPGEQLDRLYAEVESTVRLKFVEGRLNPRLAGRVGGGQASGFTGSAVLKTVVKAPAWQVQDPWNATIPRNPAPPDEYFVIPAEAEIRPAR
ncbi:MAG: type IV pilus assembly protein PilM [Planctomycetes bacterium]|nr:type IV pilus assembly protein PilM [Planctomycetota bacterium]